MEAFQAYPLTPDRWGDFITLFGPSGACYGCWCTYFRLPAKEREAMEAGARKDFIHARIENGPPPGLLGYVDGAPAGWVQVGPRSDVPRWNSARTVSRPIDVDDSSDLSAWAVSCFFIGSRHRGRGLSHHLLGAAMDFARNNGARMIEACPMDKAKSPLSLYVGSLRIFEAAGFIPVAERKPGRPLVRLSLEPRSGGD